MEVQNKKIRTFHFTAQMDYKEDPFVQLQRQCVLGNSSGSNVNYDFEISGVDGSYQDVVGYFNIESCNFLDNMAIRDGVVSLKVETTIDLNEENIIRFFEIVCMFLSENNRFIYYLDRSNKQRRIYFNWLSI